MQTLPQFLIYALCHTAIAIWKLIPAILGIAAFIAILAIGEHLPELLR